MPEDQRYDHIRRIVVDIIARRRGGDFDTLKGTVAERIKKPSPKAPGVGAYTFSSSQLSHIDSVLLTEVFWDLFRDGIITLGADATNPNFPFYRASRLFDEKARSEGEV